MFKSFINIRSNKIGIIKNTFIISFVVFLVFSRFIVDLFVVLGAISFLFLKVKNNIKINSNIFIYFIIFYIYLIISSFNSEVTLISLRTILPYIRFVLFIFFIRIYFCDHSSLKTLLYSFFFIYTILLIDVIFQIQIGHNLFGYPTESSGRISSFFGSRLILGSFISKTFAIVIFLIFYLNIKHKYFAYVVTILISIFLVYVSRERSAFFVFFGILFFSFFLIEKKYFLKITSIVLLQIVLLLFFYQQPFQRIYHHTKSQLFEESKRFAFFSERHELHYLTAFKIFNKHPFFGGGANSFRHLCDKETYSVKNYIFNNPKNKSYSKNDGYYYHIRDYFLPDNETKYDLFFVFTKVFYESYNLKNYDDNTILQLIYKLLNGEHRKSFEMYLVPHNHILDKINYKNFDYLKKNSLLFISYEFENGCNTHPHHIPIQFISETGFFGLIFLLFFYYFIYKALFIKISQFIRNGIVANDVIIYGYFFIVFFPLIPSGNFFNNYYSILLYLPLTFILLCQRK